MKNGSALAGKLIDYSLIAGGILAFNTEPAKAQVIYHDINPDIQLDSSDFQYLLDLNNDGAYDFRFTYLQTYLGLGAYSYGKVFPYNGNEIQAYLQYSGFVSPLSGGAIISAVPVWGSNEWVSHVEPLFTYDPDHYGLMGWFACVNAYAGIIFKDTDGIHYGWVRMTHDISSGHPAPLILQDYAYDTIPGEPIVAGSDYPLNAGTLASAASLSVMVQNKQLIIHLDNFSQPQVTLINISGIKLYEERSNENQLIVDANLFATGIYFIVAADAQTKLCKKVIIE